MPDGAQIWAFLNALANRLSRPEKLYLLGGSALAMLGGQRLTLDIDYLGDDSSRTALQILIEEVARSLELDVEAVPIHKFIPVPDSAFGDSLHLETIGELEVFAFDPTSIALSKIDRGLDTDLDDIVFLIRQGHVSITGLTARLEAALQHAGQYDIDVVEARAHMAELIKRLG